MVRSLFTVTIDGDENVAVAGTTRFVRFLLFLRLDFFRIFRRAQTIFFSKHFIVIISGHAVDRSRLKSIEDRSFFVVFTP